MILIVQLFVPEIRYLNKDFLKQVFVEKKKLLSMIDIRPIHIPKYDEVSVKNMIKDILLDP